VSGKDFPLVSIITPVFNGAQYIEELILSVQDQDYPSIEHIVIDDGSTDETVEILLQFSHLRWWSRENRGRFATMNEGLEKAKGEFVCFVSADDKLLKNSVAKAVNFLKLQPDYDGVVGRTQFIDEVGSVYPIRIPFQNTSLAYYPYFTQLAHCSLYIKRERLVQHGLFFNPAFHYVADYDWTLRILSTLKVGQLSDYLSMFRIHDEQTSVRYKLAMSEEKRQVLKEHHINRLFYSFLTGIFIIFHDFEKMRYAWHQGGLGMSWRLIAQRVNRSSRSK
jgi:glycosyltransferase involved in cell wall biosynthesis